MSQGVGDLDALAVTRATLAYNQTQDRISLTCALKNRECVVLWLTARLASRLVPHLCQLFAQAPDTASSNGQRKVSDNHASALRREDDATMGAASTQTPAPEMPVVAEQTRRMGGHRS